MLRGAARQHADPIQVISAFQAPRVKYDPIRRSFYLAPERAPLLGVAQARSCLKRRQSCSIGQTRQLQATQRSFRRGCWARACGAPLLPAVLSGGCRPHVRLPSSHVAVLPCLVLTVNPFCARQPRNY